MWRKTHPIPFRCHYLDATQDGWLCWGEERKVIYYIDNCILRRLLVSLCRRSIGICTLFFIDPLRQFSLCSLGLLVWLDPFMLLLSLCRWLGSSFHGDRHKRFIISLLIPPPPPRQYRHLYYLPSLTWTEDSRRYKVFFLRQQ